MKINIILSTLSVVLAICLLSCYWNKGWLTFETASNMASVVEVFVVAVSLYFIWRQVRQQTLQVRQQTELAKASNAQALFELASPFNMEIIQNREVAEFIYNGHEYYDSFNEADKFRYRNSLSWRLTFQEIIYYQKQNGLLDENIYRAWEYDFASFVERRRLKLRWDKLERYYHPEFQEYVNTVIEKVEKAPAPAKDVA